MGRYGTREAEVDRLLRGGVFVDLYRAVRQGIRASVESYSIKRLEPLYGFTREIEPARRRARRIAAFEAWLETRRRGRPGRRTILRQSSATTATTCVSTCSSATGSRRGAPSSADTSASRSRVRQPKPASRARSSPSALARVAGDRATG